MSEQDKIKANKSNLYFFDENRKEINPLEKQLNLK